MQAKFEQASSQAIKRTHLKKMQTSSNKRNDKDKRGPMVQTR